ncbi:hypothetical protein DQ04_00061310 [Trypanosoma grayi]|uniref:hypothetical protein n=1 Tax=Trypanosoma grayi TaxID=71804 RepID=UPI0004F48663|nr:hypothetical protein DQ04_00061310 [Trypanosoma grayi]KEG15493.1 hypothetical protein DQ04_00061310 [Trypanosoma grayi]
MPPKKSIEDAGSPPENKCVVTQSHLLQYSFVRRVIEENEDMLLEIDELRETVKRQAEQLIAAESRICFLEAQLPVPENSPGAAETASVANGDAVTDSNVIDKVGILRSILGAIVAYQFGDCYKRIRARTRRVMREDGKSSTEPAVDGEEKEKGQDDEEEEKCVLERALRESNRRLNEACCLLQSYQDTPSFSATASDQLVIESMMHVICLSKMLNAMALEGYSSSAAGARWLLAAQGHRIREVADLATPRLPPEPRTE